MEVTKTSKVSQISEQLCIGCNICVRVCPFNAISILNLPKELSTECLFRYGPSAFKLHRLPMIRSGIVHGLIGCNAIGKSTCLQIMAGKKKPNFGRFPGDTHEPPEWPEIIRYYRGSSLQNYFQHLCDGDLKVIIKPQFVDAIARIPIVCDTRVRDVLIQKSELKSETNPNGNKSNGRGFEVMNKLIDDLEMQPILDRKVKDLSGGELQRLAVMIATVQENNCYIYDEISNYADIFQRLCMANVISDLCNSYTEDVKSEINIVDKSGITGTTEVKSGAGTRVDKSDKKVVSGRYVLLSDHDLTLLDYLSDTISIMYGEPGAYGVVTKPSSTYRAVNNFLAGESE